MAFSPQGGHGIDSKCLGNGTRVLARVFLHLCCHLPKKEKAGDRLIPRRTRIHPKRD